MANVAIQKVQDLSQQTLPIFEEVNRRFEEVRRRAMELFEKRGREWGHALDDWLKAERETSGAWVAAELSERDNNYDLSMALPGFEPSDVQITATPREIIVRAESKREKREEHDNVLWTEFGAKRICRRFELPNPIDVDRTRASIENGMLRVTAERDKAPKERTITVAAA